jgi:hypothetical protein
LLLADTIDVTQFIVDRNRKRKLLLADTIDVTQFIVWLAEHYPESRRLMQERPEYQETFRTTGAAV